MRRIFIAVLAMSIMLVGQALASEVTRVDLSYQNGATVARIHVDGPIRFTHSTEVPKDGRPDRVIVDVISATHELGAKEYYNLPPCVVTAIRSSQYAVNPERIVRVVFDLTEAPIYRIDADQNAITIVFDYKNARPFADWSSSPSTMTPHAPAPAAPKPTAQKPAAPVTVAQKNHEMEKDRQESLSASTPAPAKPAPVTAAAPKADEKKPAVAAKPAPSVVPQAGAHGVFGNYSEPRTYVEVAPKPEQAPATPAKVSASPTTKAQPTKARATETPHNTDAKTEFESPDTKVKAAPSKPAPANSKPVPSPLPKAPAPSKTTLAKAPEQSAPAPVKKAAVPEKKATPAKETLAQAPKPTPETAATPKAKQAASVKNEKPAPAKPTPGSKTEVAAKPADKQPAGSSKTATSRFRREAVSAKIKGTMIAEFPQRLVVQYRSKGQRDPFASLVDNTRYTNNPIETRIPNIEGLRLVGIIASGEQTNRALFEDNSGYSYMLKSGDKVRNGYVLRVEVDQVFFQIFEYGWSRTVALKMD